MIFFKTFGAIPLIVRTGGHLRKIYNDGLGEYDGSAAADKQPDNMFRT